MNVPGLVEKIRALMRSAGAIGEDVAIGLIIDAVSADIARARSTAAAEAGMRGANARWHPNGTPLAPHKGANGTPSGCSSPDLLSSLSSPPPIPEADPDPERAHTRSKGLAKPAQHRQQTEANLHTRTLALFCTAWKAAYGQDYVPTPADKSQIGRLLNGLKGAGVEPDELPGLFNRYLADVDTFVAEKHRHSLAWFCTSGGLNKYRVTVQSNGLSEREKRGQRNAQVWLDMQEARDGKR